LLKAEYTEKEEDSIANNSQHIEVSEMQQAYLCTYTVQHNDISNAPSLLWVQIRHLLLYNSSEPGYHHVAEA